MRCVVFGVNDKWAESILLLVLTLCLSAGTWAESPASIGRTPAIQILSAYPDYRRAWEVRAVRDTACGPLALIAVLQCAGREVSPQLQALVRPDAEAKGVNMLELKRIAEANGLHALGAKMSLLQLKKLGLYCIARISPGHFVAIVGYTKDGTVVVPSLEGPRIVPDSVFEKGFGKTGQVLLLASDPIDAAHLGLASAKRAAGKNPLRASPASVSIRWTLDPAWTASVKLRNASGQHLTISDIKPSCNTTKASAPNVRSLQANPQR